jgi:MOSC domain-containing protein YiiM
MSVLSVSLASSHEFHKKALPSIQLLENLGVEGDCHLGTTVQHRSRLHIKPPPANLRQVHLIHSELFREFEAKNNDGGFHVEPGQLGENITTVGIDLLALSKGTRLHFINDGTELCQDHAVVRVTGLRNPCPQIDKFQKGLRERCLLRDEGRNIVGRKAGIMTVVEFSGKVERGASIIVEAPEKFEDLECV